PFDDEVINFSQRKWRQNVRRSRLIDRSDAIAMAPLIGIESGKNTAGIQQNQRSRSFQRSSSTRSEIVGSPSPSSKSGTVGFGGFSRRMAASSASRIISASERFARAAARFNCRFS